MLGEQHANPPVFWRKTNHADRENATELTVTGNVLVDMIRAT
jgi:hypothetical protein